MDAIALLEAQHGDLVDAVVVEIAPVAAARGSAVDAALIGWLCREVEAGRGNEVSLDGLLALRAASAGSNPGLGPAATSLASGNPASRATPTAKRWIAIGAVVALVAAVAIAGAVSQSTDDGDEIDTATSRSTAAVTVPDAAVAESTATTSATTTAPPPPSYRLLSEDELTAALLRVDGLPAGYSQDPDAGGGDGKTFCDYKPPFNEQIKVRRDFTKGGGISSELLSVGMRQFASPTEAKAAFDAMTQALSTCTGETYKGTNLTYAPMSAPKVGDAAVGVKMTANGSDLLQFFALVGPTILNTGGGGLMNANADEVASLLEVQVDAYQAIAS